jgi:flagellar hook-associated protein 3 FlgL
MSIQRVTQRSLTMGVLANLQSNLSKMQDIQNQLSSGKRLSKPSDGPGDTVTSLQYRQQIRRGDQMTRNAQDGLDMLGMADTTLTDSLDTMNKARELAGEGINGGMGQTEREALAAEVDTLRNTLLDNANTKILNRPLFAGAANVSAAYDATGAYQGSAPGTPGSDVMRSVGPNSSVRVNLTGPEVFGAAGSDAFTALANLADHLRNNPSAISGDLTAIDNVSTTMKNALATVGARYHQVEIMKDRLDSTKIDQTNGLNEVESIDLPESIMKLQMQQVAYQAALAATAKSVSPSLVDFIR